MIIVDYTLCIVMFGVLLLSITAGILGCFVVLRKESLLADTLSHAAFPGIASAFLCTKCTLLSYLFIGGMISSALGALLIIFIAKNSSLKKDTILGLVLSVFFGLGLILLTIIEKKNIIGQAALNKFLFGNAAALLYDEVVLIIVLSFLVLVSTYFCWKELVLVTYDSLFAYGVGYAAWHAQVLLFILLVATIVLGLQVGGVVLVSTLFVAPAVAARQWTSRMHIMMALSAFFSSFAAMAGVLISSAIERMPTGPIIVIISSSLAFISIACAPHRGFLWRYIQTKK